MDRHSASGWLCGLVVCAGHHPPLCSQISEQMKTDARPEQFGHCRGRSSPWTGRAVSRLCFCSGSVPPSQLPRQLLAMISNSCCVPGSVLAGPL